MLSTINNEIHYSNILEFWKSYSQKWFAGETLSSSTIAYITASVESFDETNPFHHVAKVIQYDQLLRHAPLREKLTPHHNEKAIYHANIFLEMTYKSKEYSDWMRVFSYLAIRHSISLDNKRRALMLSLEDPEVETSSTVIRFIRASVLDIDKSTVPKPYNTPPELPMNVSVLDKNSPTSLEPAFVKYRSMPPKFFEALTNQYKNGAAISISGGVDSMVLSFVVASKMRGLSTKPPLVFIHISYNNREEDCPHERNFLSIWTTFIKEHVYSNTTLYIREITELTRRRSSKYRAMYEDVTRRIRYNYYNKVLTHHFSRTSSTPQSPTHQSPTPQSPTPPSIPILMGHNSDDTLENVFSNLSKCIHPENLRGMSLETIDDKYGIRIVRPFLNITKTEIYEFSQRFQIPYLWDSTPSWSKRGKMRDDLIPNIRKFDPSILSGLTHMSDTMGWLYQDWLSSIREWANIEIRYREKSVRIPKDTTLMKNATRLEFWTQLWFIICPQNHRPSNKAFETFIKYFSRNPSCGNLHLSKQSIISWTETDIKITTE